MVCLLKVFLHFTTVVPLSIGNHIVSNTEKTSNEDKIRLFYNDSHPEYNWEKFAGASKAPHMSQEKASNRIHHLRPHVNIGRVQKRGRYLLKSKEYNEKERDGPLSLSERAKMNSNYPRMNKKESRSAAFATSDKETASAENQQNYSTFLMILLLMACSGFFALIIIALYYQKRKEERQCDNGYKMLPQESPGYSSCSDDDDDALPPGFRTAALTYSEAMTRKHGQQSQKPYGDSVKQREAKKLLTDKTKLKKNPLQKQHPLSKSKSLDSGKETVADAAYGKMVKRVERRETIEPNSFPLQNDSSGHLLATGFQARNRDQSECQHSKGFPQDRGDSNIRDIFKETSFSAYKQATGVDSKSASLESHRKDEIESCTRYPIYLIPVHKWILEETPEDTVIKLYPLEEVDSPPSFDVMKEESLCDDENDEIDFGVLNITYGGNIDSDGNRDFKSPLTAPLTEGRKATSCVELCQIRNISTKRSTSEYI